MPRSLFRKPAFWLIFALASLLAGFFASRRFADAFPLVSLELEMDRQQALANAAELDREHSWMGEDYRQGASFGVDSQVQAFLELEGGGREIFQELLRGGPYAPYTWHVRHFRPGEAEELHLFFRPDGRPYAFRWELPEELAGAALDQEAARAVARKAAQGGWDLDLRDWEEIEEASENLLGGRRDHVFVLRHRKLSLGEGELRLRLRVGGDRLTELTPYVRIPEAFSRRYAEMRSANGAVAGVATFVMVTLYLLVGCLGGLYWLARDRRIAVRPAWIWGFALAFLQTLASINRWPLLWMSYDTALSPANHVAWEVLGWLAELLGLGLLFSFSLMAAEGLARQAFPDHHQLWKSWTSGCAGSPTVLGQSLAGYLLVTFFFAYEVGLYWIAERHWGWWSPADALLHPDVLATYLPWLESIASSAQAGFWEECLFRALPLAGAALIGRRFGRQRTFVVVALVLQALVFGAAHATYATQPAWARLLELSLPSLGFGLLFLRFGLLPAIVLHYAFDVVWFALPLFASEAGGLTDDRILVVAFALLPLTIPAAARLRRGRFVEISEGDRNRAFESPEPPSPPPPERTPTPPLLTAARGRWLMVFGAAGLIAWMLWQDPSRDAGGLTISRAEAVSAAREALDARHLELAGEGWRALASPAGGPDDIHRFVWQEAGRETYLGLLGSYLQEPGWRVRFARFEGEVADRSEEVHLRLGDGGRVERLVHSLPEALEGAELDEAEALAKAAEAVRSRFGLDPEALEIQTLSSQQEDRRRDWVAIWEDPAAGKGPVRAEVVVEVAGTEIVDASRRVRAPETWYREQRERRSWLATVQITTWILLTLAIVAGVVYGILRWSRRPLRVRELFLWTVVLGTLSLAELGNAWPATAASFSTARSYLLQGLSHVGFGGLSLLITAGGMGLLAALLRSWWPEEGAPPRGSVLLATSGGSLASGLATFFASSWPRTEPLWPEIAPAGSMMPLLAPTLGSLRLFVQAGLLLTFVVLILFRLSEGGRRYRARLLLLCLALGPSTAVVLAAEPSVASLVAGLLGGLLLFALHQGLFSYDLGLVPGALAVFFALDLLARCRIEAFPGSSVANVLAAAAVLGAGYFWQAWWSGGGEAVEVVEAHPP